MCRRVLGLDLLHPSPVAQVMSLLPLCRWGNGGQNHGETWTKQGGGRAQTRGSLTSCQCPVNQRAKAGGVWGPSEHYQFTSFCH